jgi:hypothetical protein
MAASFLMSKNTGHAAIGIFTSSLRAKGALSMDLEQAFKQLFGRSDPGSLGLQFLIGLGFTFMQIYLVVFITKRFTYVRSHTWVAIETFIASAMCFGVYSLLVLFDLKSWAWIIPLCLFSSVVEYVVLRIDGGWIGADGRWMLGGRSMIDVDAQKKGLFQTDCRLVRRMAMATLIIMWFIWRSVSGT